MSRIWQALRQAERERATASEAAPRLQDIERDELSGPASISDPDATERRHAIRRFQDAAVLVYGSNLEKQPFHEQCKTIDANENGCLLELENVVSLGQRLYLTNTRNQAELECRVARVEPRSDGKARVGVEFIRPSAHFWRLP